MTDETGRTENNGAMLLLAVQATRAVHVFESVSALVGIGRGLTAAMLNRALLEDVLSVHWVAANKDAAPRQADKHEEATRLGERKLFAGFGRTDAVDALTAKEEARLAELADGFRGFQLSWTGEKPDDLKALVRSRVRPQDVRAVDFLYSVIQRQNNMLLHASPVAYSLSMSPGRRGPNRVGPDQWWREALAHGAAAFYLIFVVIAEEFGLDLEELDQRHHLVSCVAKKIDSTDLGELDPDDACLCGSGRAVRACHLL